MCYISIDLSNTNNNKWIEFGLVNVDIFIIHVEFELTNVDLIHEHELPPPC